MERVKYTSTYGELFMFVKEQTYIRRVSSSGLKMQLMFF